MNKLMTGLAVLMFVACGSDKFVPDDAEEDSVADVIPDSDEDTSAEVPEDTPEEPECSEDSDCDDSDPCTEDVCNSIGLCNYTEVCECREDADCDDENRCTTNECTPEGNCRTTPFVELAIEVIENVETPMISPGSDQTLLHIRFSSLIPIEIDEIRWNIGADCSGDGMLTTSSDGMYADSGGHCANSGYPAAGLYNDLETNGLIRNIEVQDTGSGATLQGPLGHPSFDLGITDDDFLSVVFIDNFTLDADSVRDVVLIADLTSVSDMRANVNLADIVFAGDPELCIDVESELLEGLTRINE